MSTKSAAQTLLPPLLAFITTIVLSVGALELPECTNGISGFIKNNNHESCEYAWIYCDGENSMYCNDDTCEDNFICEQLAVEEEQTAPAPAPMPHPPPPSPPAVVEEAPPAANNTSKAPQTTTESTTAAAVNVRVTCQRGVFDNYPYPRNCNYYYQCVDGYLIVQQCPFGFRYDAEREVCTSEPNISCNNVSK